MHPWWLDPTTRHFEFDGTWNFEFISCVSFCVWIWTLELSTSNLFEFS
jgi:hypothetical protein